jgi:hypothetical protein
MNKKSIVAAVVIVALGAAAGAAGAAQGSGGSAPKASGAVNGKVKVRITFKNDGRDVSDGTLAGAGRFTASGAINDQGKVLIYRTMKGGLITLRDVASGKKGSITFVVKIDTTTGTSRWTITSGTRAYKGLRGKGTERENPPDYNISILTGTVSR